MIGMPSIKPEHSEFHLGRVVVTPAVAMNMQLRQGFAVDIRECLRRHASGDWGDVGKEDTEMNNNALEDEKIGGYSDTLFSMYEMENDTIFIITEGDRSVTTILFPDEY